MNPAIEQGKRAIKARVQAELSAKLAALRKRHPDKNTPELWKELQASEGELLAYCSRIENNHWSPPTSATSKLTGTKLVKAKGPRDNREVMLIMAADGTTVADIVLE